MLSRPLKDSPTDTNTSEKVFPLENEENIHPPCRKQQGEEHDTVRDTDFLGSLPLEIVGEGGLGPRLGSGPSRSFPLEKEGYRNDAII